MLGIAGNAGTVLPEGALVGIGGGADAVTGGGGCTADAGCGPVDG